MPWDLFRHHSCSKVTGNSNFYSALPDGTTGHCAFYMWEYWSSSLRSPECALPPFPSIKPSLSATTPPIYGHPTKEKLCTQNACLPSKCALVVVILQERSTVGRQHRASKEGAGRRPQSASQSFDKRTCLRLHSPSIIERLWPGKVQSSLPTAVLIFQQHFAALPLSTGI